MKKYPIKGIINHIVNSRILYDYDDCESFEVINSRDVSFLKKSFVSELNLTAFMVNMAIMYVNQGLLYAKSKLSVYDFDNYMIWFHIEKDDCLIKRNHYYNCQVLYTRKPRTILQFYANLINIEYTCIYDLIKDVIGLSDFYCYELCYDGSDYIQYAFVPKYFVEKYSSSSEK